MVESSPSRQRRHPGKKNKEMSDEAADAAALTYLLTYWASVGGGVKLSRSRYLVFHFELFLACLQYLKLSAEPSLDCWRPC